MAGIQAHDSVLAPFGIACAAEPKGGGNGFFGNVLRFTQTEQEPNLGIYREFFLPRIIRWAMSGKELHEARALALAGASGKVLEIGLGNGLNLRHYGPEVASVTGIDPAGASEKLARKEISQAPFPVEVEIGSAEAMPFAEHAFDSVAMTWTLCTIPDPGAALAEIRRVLRPEDRLFFVEHGRSPDAGVARWQDRLNALQGFVAGGCNLNREIGRLIAEAGFKIESLENDYIRGPPTHTYLYRGVASAHPPGA